MRAFLSFRPFTGLHMLLIMVAFFGTVIVVNINMAVRANTTFTGLVAKNGYVASIDYQRDMEGRAAAQALGWTVAHDEAGGFVTFTVTGEEAAPVYMSAVDAVAVRSITRDEPQHLMFESVGGGTYRSVEALPAGNWVVQAHLRKSETVVPWRAVVSVE
jgi:nitrogen fixation protein FixH